MRDVYKHSSSTGSRLAQIDVFTRWFLCGLNKARYEVLFVSFRGVSVWIVLRLERARLFISQLCVMCCYRYAMLRLVSMCNMYLKRLHVSFLPVLIECERIFDFFALSPDIAISVHAWKPINSFKLLKLARV